MLSVVVNCCWASYSFLAAWRQTFAIVRKSVGGVNLGRQYGTPSPPKIDFYYVNRSYCTRTDSPRSHRLPQIAPIRFRSRPPLGGNRQYSVLRSPYRTAQQLPIPLASTEHIFAYRFDEIDRMCAYRFPKS